MIFRPRQIELPRVPDVSGRAFGDKVTLSRQFLDHVAAQVRQAGRQAFIVDRESLVVEPEEVQAVSAARLAAGAVAIAISNSDAAAKTAARSLPSRRICFCMEKPSNPEPMNR